MAPALSRGLLASQAINRHSLARQQDRGRVGRVTGRGSSVAESAAPDVTPEGASRSFATADVTPPATAELEPKFAFVTASLPWDQARRWLLDFERDYADLDPGIRFAVRTLRAAGVETFESCEGGEGHAYAEPTVRFRGQQSAGWRALTAVMEYGLPVSAIRQTWPIWEGQPHGPYWEITFAEPIDRPTLEGPK